MPEKMSTPVAQFNPLAPFNPLEAREFSAGAGPGLVMRAAAQCARLSLRIGVDHLKKAEGAFNQFIPASIGAMSQAKEKYALCLGPDEWLLLAPLGAQEEIVARFAELGPDIVHALVDVGQRTVGIELSGPMAARTLNAGCPLDLDRMKAGRCARTVLDSCEIILMKLQEQHYRLEIARSFAPFAWSFLEKAGGELTITNLE